MADVLTQLFATHGVYLLIAVVFADQAGLPIPALPLLLAAGVLLRAGSVPFWPLFVGCCLASWIGHTLWYAAGRRQGPAIVKLLCRMSLSPDACVRRTQDAFSHIGPWSLLWLRFVPGLDVLAQPLVAMNGMPWSQYLAITAAGTVLWVGAYLGLGYAVGGEEVFGALQALGARMFPLLALAFLLYLISKAGWRFNRNTREVPRLEPAALAELMHGDMPVIIVDLRRRYELKHSGRQIPGSRRLNRRELRTLTRTPVPGTAAVVLCECPGESGSAWMASVFKRNGWAATYALAGGFSRWAQEGRPTEALTEASKNVDV
jgi:membrane protein DedA with SNARE-associated domain/rhodanese-related sulfurtransferase